MNSFSAVRPGDQANPFLQEVTEETEKEDHLPSVTSVTSCSKASSHRPFTEMPNDHPTSPLPHGRGSEMKSLGD
jgi:hypothetical protein